MSSFYRLSAWLVEMLVEALSFYFVATVISHTDGPTTAKDVAAFLIGTLTFFGISGYAVTTLAMRLVLRGRWSRVYPIIAPLLFLVHFQIMNLMVPGGLLDTGNRFVFRLIGSGVVLLVATAISLLLERLERKLTVD